MVLEKIKTIDFPNDAYVDVLEPIDADATIIYPYVDDEFTLQNCVCIFWIKGINNNRVYFLAEYFDVFTQNTLIEINKGYYYTEGVLVFYRDLKFLDDFKTYNKKFIKSIY